MYFADVNLKFYLLRNSIPIPGNGHIAWITQAKDELGEAIGVLIAQEERPSAIDADGVDPVVVPVTHDRLIAWQAVIECNIRKASVVTVLQEDHTVARSEYSHRRTAVVIPIPYDWKITCCTQRYRSVDAGAHSAVAQEECVGARACGGSEYSDGRSAVSIPVADYGDVCRRSHWGGNVRGTRRIAVAQEEISRARSEEPDSAAMVSRTAARWLFGRDKRASRIDVLFRRSVEAGRRYPGIRARRLCLARDL